MTRITDSYLLQYWCPLKSAALLQVFFPFCNVNKLQNSTDVYFFVIVVSYRPL